MTHDLKCWPEYFQLIVDKKKTFEIRKNDRGFEVGDILYLREYDPITQLYTGRYETCRVLYVLQNYPAIQSGHVVMSIKVVNVAVLDIKNETTIW